MPGYEGNPYRKHQLIDAQRPFTVAHFERWLELFHETLDLGWSGPKADQAKALADKVARVHAKGIIGQPVTCFAYPYGAYDGTTTDIVAEAGFAIAFDAWGGVAPLDGSVSRYHLPRIEVASWMTVDDLAASL
jgi:peptidoglycan/xylan/chitin deacetylase (PgdA/CDA1 family)